MVRQNPSYPVPLHLRNAPTKLMDQLGYGAEYKYAHDNDNNFVDLDYLPEELKGTKFFKPGNNPRENEILKFLQARWKDKYGY